MVLCECGDGWMMCVYVCVVELVGGGVVGEGGECGLEFVDDDECVVVVSEL